MVQANSLAGDPRYAAYQTLDFTIQQTQAPLVVYENRNIREFVASRIGGYVFTNTHGLANLNTFFIE